MSNARINEEDERDLRWFFSQGQTAFEKSPMGGMLERARLMSSGSRYDVGAGEIVSVPHPRRHGNLTVRPRGDRGESAGYLPDTETLERFALVSRALKRMEALDQIGPAVLELYHGDRGQVWARIDPPGRIAALFAIVPAGRELLRISMERGKKKNQPDLGLGAQERMENEVAAQKANPNDDRHALLLRAEGQSRALYEDACRLWNQVKNEPRAK